MAGSLLEAFKSNDPEGIALIWFEDIAGKLQPVEFTFDTIWKAALRLAERIECRQTVIPVIVRHSPLTYVTQLAILISGNAFCPVSIDSPIARIESILDIVEARCLVHDGSVELSNLHITEKAVDMSIFEDIESVPENTVIAEFDVAYVLFTSGSTGVPKGVPITHKSLDACLRAHDWVYPRYNIDSSGSRFLQFASSTFDVSIFEIYSSWRHHLTLVTSSRDTLINRLPDLIFESKVQGLELTPSMADLISLPHNEHKLKNIKVLISIGEMMTQRMVDFWDERLLNAYGPTEATIHTSLLPFNKSLRPSLIGFPLDGVSFVILDEFGRQSKPGEVGELAIGGPFRTTGYLKRPELNETAFLEVPMLGRLYKSGDLARENTGDGCFEIIGRAVEGQVKLNGRRIELGEIDSAIKPVVNESVLLKVDDFVVAFIVGDREKATAAAAEKLPHWMLPLFFPLERLPKLDSGKADKKELAKIFRKNFEQRTWAASDENDAVVCLIRNFLPWIPVSLSKATEVSSLGLDSITALRLSARLNELEDSSISARDIISSSNIGEICDKMKAFKKCDYNSDYSCTPIQTALISQTLKATEESPLYFNLLEFSINETFSAMDIERACISVLQSDEILCHRVVEFEQGLEDQNDLFAFDSNPSRPKIQINDTQYDVRDVVNEFQNYATALFATIRPKENVLSIWIHHSLYDGWSVELLAQRLCLALMGDTQEAHPKNYFNFVRQIKEKSESNQESDQRFWRQYLENAPESIIRPNRIIKGNENVTIERTLNLKGKDLDHYANAFNVAPQCLIQMEWGRLLSRHLNMNETMFFSTFSTRGLYAGSEDVIGPFIATVPTKVSCLSETNEECLQKIECANSDAMSHINLDLSDMAKISSASANTLVIFQRNLRILEKPCIRAVKSRDFLEYAILVEMEVTDDDAVIIRLTSAQFSSVAVSLYAEDLRVHLMATLENTQAVYDQSLLAISKFQPLEQYQDENLVSMVTNTCRRHPTDIAVEFMDDLNTFTRMTYGELDAISEFIAFRLISDYGYTSNDVIVICMRKSVYFYAYILAILKTGAAYVPLAEDVPLGRLKAILEVLGTKKILTDNPERFPGFDTIVIEPEASKSKLVYPVIGSKAYVIFTSGTTGTPKGCPISHKNVVSNIIALSRIYRRENVLRMLQFSGVAFDVSVFEIFYTFFMGGTLCAAPRSLLIDFPNEVASGLRVTHISATATGLSLFSRSLLPNVQVVISAGERLTQAVQNEWSSGTSCTLYNSYGPTEATNVVLVKPNVCTEDEAGDIGWVLPGNKCAVIGDDGCIQSRLAIGELCLQGVQVFSGYMNTSSESAFVRTEYGTFYRTGDKAQMMPDERIVVLGRIDDQIKIRGFRVELSEISAVISEQTGLDCATVLTKEDLPCIATFIACNSKARYNGSISSDFDKKLLRYSIQARIPEYMMPTYIIPLNCRLPMTQNNKFDRTEALNVLVHAPTENGFEHQDLSLQERKIANHVSTVLKVPISSMRPDGSLYGLGLDSIKAVMLSRRLKNELGLEVTVSNLLQGASLSSLAKFEETARSEVKENVYEKHENDLKSMLPKLCSQTSFGLADVSKILPCSKMQVAILSHSQGDSAAYLNDICIDLPGRCSVKRLQDALSSLINRHEIFRTVFVRTMDRNVPFAQIILEKLSGKIQIVDEEPLLAEHAKSIMESGSPPYMIFVVKSTKPRLRFFLHHALYDGWSLERTLIEFWQSYEGHVIQKPSVKFEDYLRLVYNQDIEKNRLYWSSLLHGYQVCNLPSLDVCNPTNPRPMFCKQQIPIKSAVAEDFCKAYNVTLLSLCQASWARVLFSLCRTDDVVFGNVLSGRSVDISDIESLIAPTFTTIPVRCKRTSSFESLLKLLVDQNARSLEYQLTGLRDINKFSDLRETKSLFNSALIMQPKSQLSSTGLEVTYGYSFSEFDYLVEFIIDDTIDIQITSNSNMVSDKNMGVLLSLVTESFIHGIKQPRATIGFGFDFLAERPDLLSASAVPDPPTDDEIILDGFGRAVSKHGEKDALIFVDSDLTSTRLSFSQLDRLSNVIALRILQLFQSGSRYVPVIMSKSQEFYVIVLSIFKAGCVYVPIGIDTPLTRMQKMLENLDCKQVISTTDLDLSEIGILSISDKLLFENLDAAENEVNLDTLGNHNITRQSPAYVFHTSGSTGTPKAVQISHGAAIDCVKYAAEAFPLDEKSKWLQYAATTFDMSMFDILICWFSGTTMVSAAQATLSSHLNFLIHSMSITHLDLTPSVVQLLRLKECDSVTMLFCIGEALTPKIASIWKDRCYNNYGPTEAAMACTVRHMDGKIKAANIGFPYKHSRVYVVDENEQLCPKGRTGELVIGGTQLADSYIGNESQTKAKFKKFNYDGQRVYFTGDFVRMMLDGSLEYVGREDSQIKLRGQRIDTKEIDFAITKDCDEIKSSHTFVLKHPTNKSSHLVSFVETFSSHADKDFQILTLHDNLKALRNAAYERLRASVPSYMIPEDIAIINTIPLSTAGKANKQAVEAIYWQQDFKDKPESESSFDVMPCVLECFSEFSGVEKSQIHHDMSMLSLGLDSISAIQMSYWLKENHDLAIKPIELYQNDTPMKLSLFITTKESVAPSSTDLSSQARSRAEMLLSRSKIQVGDLDYTLPCTESQKSFIGAFCLSEEPIYLNYALYEIRDSMCDTVQLRKRISSLQQNNSIFRTIFVRTDDFQTPFLQVCLSEVTCSLQSIIISEQQSLRQALNAYRDEFASKLREELSIVPHVFAEVTQGDKRYLLFLALHAIFDAWSLKRVFQEIATGSHTAKIKDEEALIWILSEEERCSNDANSTFWIDKITPGSGEVPNFNTTSVVGTRTVSSKAACHLQLSQAESQCKALNISLSAAGRVAWAKALSAYRGDNIVTFGHVLSGRTGLSGIESSSIPCLVTVPNTVNVEGSLTEILTSLSRFDKLSLDKQHTSLESIAKWLGANTSNLFDSVFVFQKTAPVGSGHAFDDPLIDDALAVKPISVEMLLSGENSIEFQVISQESFVPQEQNDLIASSLANIFDVIMNNPGANVSEVESLLDRRHLSVVPAEINEFRSDFVFLHDFVEHHARIYPSKLALEVADDISDEECVNYRSFTFEKLNSMANWVASEIEALQLSPKTVIAICFDKQFEAFVTILAILKSGHGYLALDFTAPEDRKAFILKDSGCELLLTCPEFERTFVECRNIVRILATSSLLSFYEEKDSSRVQNKRNPISPDDVAYVLYTSGSTGRPKGCEISHYSAVQGLLSFKDQFSGCYDERSKFLAFASLHFDVSVLEQYWSWCVGASVVALPKAACLQDIPLVVRMFKITHLDLTPTLGSLLEVDEVPTLRVLITGGEQMRADMMRKWGPTGKLFNFWGPTELTIGASVLPHVPSNARPSNIGHAFRNCSLAVMNPIKMCPVLRGAVGEIVMGGAQVAKGYVNLPEQTDKVFKYLPYWDGKSYFTGDMARLSYDGTIDFAGRRDDQIKLRGQRIEIEEINNVIIKGCEPAVTDAITLVLKKHEKSGDFLVSFLELGGQKTSSTEVLQDQRVATEARLCCQRKLAAYMVPSFFIVLSKIPLTPTNKVDRKYLAALFKSNDAQSGDRSSSSQEEIQDEREKLVADILSDFTGVRRQDMRRTTSILELGINSISVISLLKAFQNKGYALHSVADVMKHNTVSTLAQILDAVDGVREDDKAVPTRVDDAIVEDICKKLPFSLEVVMPCTPLVSGMLSENSKSKQRPYINSFEFTLHQEVDLHKFESCWIRAISRHQVLRSIFLETEAGHIVAVADSKHSEKFWNCRVDLTIPVTELDRPPYEMILEARTLKLHIFHGVYDGFSFDQLLSEIWDEYDGEQIPDRPTYSDVLPYLLQYDESKSRQFWTDAIHVQPVQGSDRSESLQTLEGSFSIGRDVLLAACKEKLRCTPQVLLLAVWQLTLRKLLGVCTSGVVLSGRSSTLNSMNLAMGPMFNTVPFQLMASETATWKELAQQCQKKYTEVLSFQNTPLRLVRKWLKVTNADDALFNNVFVFNSQQKRPHNRLWKQHEEDQIAVAPISIDVTDDEHFRYLLKGSFTPSELDFTAVVSELEYALCRAIESANGEIRVDMTTPDLQDASQDATTQVLQGDRKAWSETERAVRDIIVAMTGATNVDSKASIYALGIDSVDAVSLTSRLRKQGYQIKLDQVLRLHTIEAIGQAMTRKQETKNEGEKKTEKSILAIYKEKLGSGSYPLTSLQHSMLLQTLHSSEGQYLNHSLFKLEEHVSLTRLRDAWLRVMQQVEMLRAVFPPLPEPLQALNGQLLYQKFLDHVTAHIEVDLAASESETLDDRYRNHKIECRRKFNPQVSTPVSIKITSGNEGQFLFFSIHHALYDGASMELLLEAVADAYEGRPIRSLLPFSRFLDRVWDEEARESSRSYWKSMVPNLEPCLLPKMHAYSTLSDAILLQHEAPYGTRDVRDLCGNMGVSPLAAMQACYALALARMTQQQSGRVCFGNVSSRRHLLEGGESVAGPCMGTFPTMATVNYHGRGAMRRLAQELHLHNTQGLVHQYTSLQEIGEMAGIASNRLFNTIFLLQRQGGAAELKHPLWSEMRGDAELEYALAIEAEMGEQCIVWRLRVDPQYLSFKEAQDFLHNVSAGMSQFDREESSPASPMPVAAAAPAFAEAVQVIQQVVHPIMCIQTEDSVFCKIDDGDEFAHVRWPEHVRSQLEYALKLDFNVDCLPRYVVAYRGNPESVPTLPADARLKWDLDMTPGPVRATAERLASIVESFVDVAEGTVRADTRLHTYGVDSVSAIRLSKEFKRQGFDISVLNIIQLGTLDRMALMLERRAHTAPQRNGAEAVETCAPRSQTEALIPCAPGQTFILASWLGSQGRQFFSTFAFTVDPARLAHLQMRWERACAASCVLRCTVHTQKGPGAFALRETSRIRPLRVLETDDVDKAIVLTREECSRIDDTPPVYPIVAKSSTGSVLILHIHHVLYDGVSLGMILDMLLGEEEASISGPLEHQAFAKQVALRQDSHIIPYWTRKLEGAVDNLRRHAAAPSSRAAAHVFHRHIHIANAGVATSMIARVVKAAAALLGEPEVICFGLYIQGRTMVEEGLCGPTFNVIPIVVRGAASTDTQDIAETVAKALRDAAGWTEQVDLLRLAQSLQVEPAALFMFTVNYLESSTHADADAAAYDVSHLAEQLSVPSAALAASFSTDPAHRLTCPLDIEVKRNARDDYAIGCFGWTSTYGREQLDQLVVDMQAL